MKRVTIPIVFLLVVVVSVTAIAMDLPDPAKVPFDQAVKELNTPQKVNAWIQKYMAYDYSLVKELIKLANDAMKRGIKERTDAFNDLIWNLVRYPSETYTKRGGVCCDIANFATHCLKQAGYDAMVVGCRLKRSGKKTGGRSHAVCVLRLEDEWYVVANATPDRIYGLDGPYPKLRQLLRAAFWEQHYGIKYIFNIYTKTEGQTAREQYDEWSVKEFCNLYDK
jgi:hypothetical protein